MKDENTVSATIAALFAQIIFGFSFMFTKIAQEYTSPMSVISGRYLIAFVTLSIIILIRKEKISFGKNIHKLIFMSVFQPLLYFICESYGIKLTTSAFSSVMIAMIPVVSMVCGIFVLKEYPSFLQYVFTAMSVGGVAVMALLGNADGTVTIYGILLLAGAVISSVAYNIMSRKISSDYSAFERTYAMTIVGAISFFIMATIENPDNYKSIFTAFTNCIYLGSLLYLGVFSSVIAFLFLNYANTHLPVAKTTVFSNVTTVVSVVAGAIFINENITWQSLLAICMIIFGVMGVQLTDVKKSIQNND